MWRYANKSQIESDIVWICDKCGASLNIQLGFSEDCGECKCTECGYSNVIGPSELYETEDEYQMELKILTEDCPTRMFLPCLFIRKRRFITAEKI